MRMLAVTVVAVTVAGCAKPDAGTQQAGTCLALPPEFREDLRSAPDGSALYWFERTRLYDFDGDLRDFSRLVRYDLAAKRVETLFDYALPPLNFVRGGLVVGRSGQKDWLSFVDAKGGSQDLTEGYFDVRDFELVDDHTIALRASGDGESAVFVLDLDRPRPRHLVDADILLSTSGGHVYVVANDAGLGINLATGSQQAFTWDRGSVPLADSLFDVSPQRTIVARSMATNAERVVVGNVANWKLVHQTGSILARTAPTQGLSQAVVIKTDGVRYLPNVRGGTSILSTAEVGTNVWALVGHNTSNYVGDLGNTYAETNVCLLPDAPEVTFETRSVPARYADYWERMHTALAGIADDARLQIIDGGQEPVTVYIALDKERGGTDLARMRKRVEFFHMRVTSYLADRQVRTEVRFADGRTGIHRWRRSRLRDRVSVGIGDALLSDPATYDAEVHDLKYDEHETRDRCSGTLVNTQAKPLDDVRIRCWRGRKPEVVVAKLEPNERRAFELENDVDEATRDFHVAVHNEPLEVNRPELEARMQKVFELAAQIREETDLTLQHHNVDDEIVVTVEGEPAFLRLPAVEQHAAASGAWRRFAGLAAIYESEKSAMTSMTITVRGADTTYDFDGDKLTLRR